MAENRTTEDRIVSMAILGMKDAIWAIESNSTSRDDKLVATGELKAISKMLIGLNHKGLLNIVIRKDGDTDA